MKLKEFILDFKNRKGFPILLSSVYEKFAGLLIVLIATWYLSKSEYGFITYANSTLDFLFPFIGFGLHQSLLRFGAISKSQLTKKELFLFSLRRGLMLSFGLIILVFIFSYIITQNIEKSLPYLLILSFQFVGLYIYELIRVYVQLLHLNSYFVKITVVKTTLQLILIFILTYFFGPFGYVIALTISSLIVSIIYLYHLKMFKLQSIELPISNFRKYFSYGLQTSISGVISQLMYATDMILIANILKDEMQLAQYRISSIVPFSFLFVSVAFLKTHLIKIANHSIDNKYFIKSYYINYLKIFSVVSLLILVFFSVFYQQILMMFGKDYHQDFGLMQIFTIGIVGAILLRIPLGNILAAVGWVKINTLNSLVIAILNIVLNFFAIKYYGVYGAAIITSGLLWLSGVFSLIGFIFYLKK